MSFVNSSHQPNLFYHKLNNTNITQILYLQVTTVIVLNIEILISQRSQGTGWDGGSWFAIVAPEEKKFSFHKNIHQKSNNKIKNKTFYVAFWVIPRKKYYTEIFVF